MADADFLRDLSEAALARAVRRSVLELNRFLRVSPTTHAEERGDLYRWRSRVPHAYFNGVLAASRPGSAAAGHAREAVDWFRSHGVESFTWWFEPDVPAASWAEVLLPLGFELDDKLPGMAIDLETLDVRGPESGASVGRRLEVRLVEGSRALREWLEVFLAGYGLPASWADLTFPLFDDLHGADSPLQSYVGLLDGVPVATSSVFYRYGVAGIYDVATLPAARGLGLGSAVTREPLLEARRRGYRVGVLQSSAVGLRVYERLGFRTVANVSHYAWKARP